MSFESFKKFINEKIFHKKDQKLLIAANTNSRYEYDEKINLKPIEDYIEKQKYMKDFSVSFMAVEPRIRKALMKKIALKEKGNITFTHDDFTLVEGYFSKEPFISVRRKNVKTNKIGQTIVSANNYIDISTRKKYKNSNVIDLQFKQLIKNGDVEDYCSYDEDNELYCRRIKRNRSCI